jgi:hypothetical protein
MSCITTRPIAGCFTNAGGVSIAVIIHISYKEGQPISQNVTNAIDTDTIIDVTGGTLTAGACPMAAVASPDVEWLTQCDRLADNSLVVFICRTITQFNAAGTPSVAVDNFQLDKVTPYIVQGTVEDCSDCGVVTVLGALTDWADLV